MKKLNSGIFRNVTIWIVGLVSYFFIGKMLNGFTYEGAYVIRIVLFLLLAVLVSLLYYVNIELRNVNYGEESNLFWRWIEKYVPFIILFPAMVFLFSFLVIGFTYLPDVAPYNYFINYCLGLFPFYLLVFLNDLSIYLEHLNKLWEVESSEKVTN